MDKKGTPWSSMAQYEKEELILSGVKRNPLSTQRELCIKLGVCGRTLRKYSAEMAEKGIIKILDYGNAYAYVI